MDHNRHLLFAGASACPPLLGVQASHLLRDIEQRNCRLLNEKIFNYVAQHQISSVVLVGRWSYYTRGSTHADEFVPLTIGEVGNYTTEESRRAFEYGLRNTFDQYKARGVRVYVVKDVPQQLLAPAQAVRTAFPLNDKTINALSVSREEHERNNAFPDSVIRAVSRRYSNVRVINLDPVVCDQKICPMVRNGKFMYFDRDHLSVAGAKYIYRRAPRLLSDPEKWGGS